MRQEQVKEQVLSAALAEGNGGQPVLGQTSVTTPSAFSQLFGAVIPAVAGAASGSFFDNFFGGGGGGGGAQLNAFGPGTKRVRVG